MFRFWRRNRENSTLPYSRVRLGILKKKSHEKLLVRFLLDDRLQIKILVAERVKPKRQPRRHTIILYYTECTLCVCAYLV